MDDEAEAVETIRKAFKLTCRKCGSENTAINFSRGIDYGGDTGYQAGHFDFGCNDCKDNDVFIWV